MTRSKLELLISLTLMVVTVAVFWPVRNVGFLTFDDPLYLTENPHIRTGLTFENVKWAFSHQPVGYWGPLSRIPLMVNCELFGLNAGAHHLMSLLLHSVNTVLLFLVLGQLTNPRSKVQSLKSKVTPPDAGLQTSDSPREIHCGDAESNRGRNISWGESLQPPASSLWRCAVVAALFAWHPLRVEPVAWAVQIDTPLSGLFWLLTIWAYSRYAEGQRGKGAEGKPWTKARMPLFSLSPFLLFYLLALAFFALGLMTKPILVTLPFVLLLLDYWPLQRFTISTAHSAGLCGPLPPIPPHPQNGQLGEEGLLGGEGELQPPPNHKSSILNHKLGLLLEKLPFFVMALALAFVAVLTEQKGGTVATLEESPLGHRLAAALVSYVTYLRKAIWPHDLAVFYPGSDSVPLPQLVMAILLLGGISIGVLVARRTRPYLAVGWFWFLGVLLPVLGLVSARPNPMADRYAYIPLIGLFIALVWVIADLSATRPRWRALVVWPVSLAACIACIGMTRAQLGHWESTETLFRHALRVTKGNYLAHALVGEALVDRGEFAEARAHFEAALALNPRHSYAHLNFGNLLSREDRLEEAIAHYTEAIKIHPGFALAHNNLGAALLRQGRAAEALQQLLIAAQGNPSFVETHQLLGEAYGALNRPGEAMAAFRAALRLNPNDCMAHNNLANALLDLGQMEAAIEHLRKALQINPDYAPALNTLAWLRATHRDARFRDAQEAVRLAEHAVVLTKYADPRTLDTLAAAYAEAGQFADAVTTARLALELPQTPARKELAAHIRQRLAIYEAGKPYRE